MDIRELKESIENKSLPDNIFYIFKVKSFPSFIVDQYIKAISDIKNLEISYLQEDSSLFKDNKDLFISSSNKNELIIYKTDKIEKKYSDIKSKDNLIIVTKEIDEDVITKYFTNIVEIPELEKWQIISYAKSISKGIEDFYIENLVDYYKNNIYKLDNELSKYSLFTETQRKFLFEQAMNNNEADLVGSNDIWGMIGALQKRDKEGFKKYYSLFQSTDTLGILSLFYQNFKKLISVWLEKNPTPESTGLKSNQIWAIKNLPINYSKNELIDLVDFLSDLDYNIKCGKIPADIAKDYILIRIFTK